MAGTDPPRQPRRRGGRSSSPAAWCRVTGSGLGCPTWPECVDGSITPTVEQAEGFHKYVEFGNRTLTGVVGCSRSLRSLAVWLWAPRRAMKVGRSSSSWGGPTGRARRVHRAASASTPRRSPRTSSCRCSSSPPRPTCGSPGTRPRQPPPLVPPLVTRLGVGARVSRGARAAPRHPRHRVGTALRRCRRAGPLRLRRPHVSWLHADVVMLFLGLVVATWLLARLTCPMACRGPAARGWSCSR